MISWEVQVQQQQQQCVGCQDAGWNDCTIDWRNCWNKPMKRKRQIGSSYHGIKMDYWSYHAQHTAAVMADCKDVYFHFMWLAIINWGKGELTWSNVASIWPHAYVKVVKHIVMGYHYYCKTLTTIPPGIFPTKSLKIKAIFSATEHTLRERVTAADCRSNMPSCWLLNPCFIVVPSLHLMVPRPFAHWTPYITLKIKRAINNIQGWKS